MNETCSNCVVDVKNEAHAYTVTHTYTYRYSCIDTYIYVKKRNIHEKSTRIRSFPPPFSSSLLSYTHITCCLSRA